MSTHDFNMGRIGGATSGEAVHKAPRKLPEPLLVALLAEHCTAGRVPELRQQHLGLRRGRAHCASQTAFWCGHKRPHWTSATAPVRRVRVLDGHSKPSVMARCRGAQWMTVRIAIGTT